MNLCKNAFLDLKGHLFSDVVGGLPRHGENEEGEGEVGV
jgi:hypothetical protein